MSRDALAEQEVGLLVGMSRWDVMPVHVVLRQPCELAFELTSLLPPCLPSLVLTRSVPEHSASLEDERFHENHHRDGDGEPDTLFARHFTSYE